MDPVKRAREFNQRGLAAMDCGQFDAAAEFFRNATVAVPHAAGAHNNLGFALFQLGRYQEAIESYDRAVEIQPNYAAAYDNRANALYQLKSFEAVVSYDAAIAINPDYPGVHRRKGLALMKLGRYADALRSFDQEPASDAALAEMIRADCPPGARIRIAPGRGKAPRVAHR
jgi:tetratricopeptide (TPR) repeat protein